MKGGWKRIVTRASEAVRRGVHRIRYRVSRSYRRRLADARFSFGMDLHEKEETLHVLEFARTAQGRKFIAHLGKQGLRGPQITDFLGELVTTILLYEGPGTEIATWRVTKTLEGATRRLERINFKALRRVLEEDKHRHVEQLARLERQRPNADEQHYMGLQVRNRGITLAEATRELADSAREHEKIPATAKAF